MANGFVKFQFTSTGLILIGMNFIPLAGVFWFGWDVGIIIFLYWLENVIIGLLNIPKILCCRSDPKKGPSYRESFGGLVFLCLFFSFHYGVFCFGHYMFLRKTYHTLPDWDGIVSALFSPLLFWSLLGLALSHLISMFVNFFGKEEYKIRSAKRQMGIPYSRILILHFVIILGSALAVAMGQGLAMLLLLVMIKIGFDLAAHLAEHSIKEKLASPLET